MTGRRKTTAARNKTKNNGGSASNDKSLDSLRHAAAACTNCDLYKYATQIVFGAGDEHAKVMFVGEQPGDCEDLAGKPFVGPAGKLLDKAMEEAGIDRKTAYVTNAVKHFKFAERGKRRIHKQPRVFEIKACQPWLLAEIDCVRPIVVVCLGGTAAKSLLNEKAALMKQHGKVLHANFAPFVVQTMHPSAILRQPDSEHRHQAYDQLVNDLRTVANVLRKEEHK